MESLGKLDMFVLVMLFRWNWLVKIGGSLSFLSISFRHFFLEKK